MALMYPPSTTWNTYKDVIGRSKKHGLTRVLRQDIRDGWLSRRILPLNTEAQQQNVTWTNTYAMDAMTCVGWPKGVKGNSEDWLSAEVPRIMICAKWQSVVFKGDSKKCWMMFSRDCLACSFQFFPHPDRWVPLFDLMRSRITHARYNSPSVSSSSFV